MLAVVVPYTSQLGEIKSCVRISAVLADARARKAIDDHYTCAGGSSFLEGHRGLQRAAGL